MISAELEHRNIRIVQMVFLVWVLLASTFQFRLKVPLKPVDHEFWVAFSAVAMVLTCAVVVLRFTILRKIELRVAAGERNPLRIVAYLVAFGLSESVALMGIALRTAGASPAQTLIFFVISGVLILVCSPRRV